MPKLSETPTVAASARVTATTLGRYTEIAEGCAIDEADIGDYSYLMQDCMVWCATIGKFANIAARVRPNATHHPMDRATLHHFTYRASDYWDDAGHESEFFARRRQKRVWIGHDTWLGHNATVLPGVRVADGAVVGSGAVVTRDVGPYEIVGGVPARLIRRRFSSAVAERMASLAWWDWDHARLRGALEDFRSLSAEAFLEKHGA